MEYEPVIGLEIHVQLNTRSKMFCGCGADYQSAEPNTRVCPVCMALPGTLPVVNRGAVESAMMIGLALNCQIAPITKFDRKNYPYPDLMKGYQISQYDMPICHDGWMMVSPRDGDGKAGDPVRIGVTRVHMEEDVARMTHIDTMGNGHSSSRHAYTLMDINRAGVPLMEVVSEPDIHSTAEAEAYITKLQNVIRYLGVGTASMEEGSFRVDANVSVRPKGSSELRERVEVKNMNRVRAVVRALEYEMGRQIDVYESGGRVEMHTVGWDDELGATRLQRSKEEAHDYRYFPEPDLPPLEINRDWVEDVRARLPELAEERRDRFQSQYGLSEYDATLLTAARSTADYFEEVLNTRDLGGDELNAFAKEIANWINGEVARVLNEPEGPSDVREMNIPPAHLARLAELFQERKISNAAAREVFQEMMGNGRDPDAIVEERGLLKVSGSDQLTPVVAQAIASNPKAVQDYMNGKETAVRFLVGQVMKATRGTADAGVAAELITEKLNEAKTTG